MLEGRRRIMVVGCGGAGKSTLSRDLGRLTGLPVIHLDRLFWQPGWVATPRDEWRETVIREAAKDRWILDGNYGGTLQERTVRADTIVFLDIGRMTCVLSALKRVVTNPFWPREDLPDGCDERLNWEFLRWIWAFRRDSRARILKALKDVSPDVAVIWLKSRKEIGALLAAVVDAEAGLGGEA